MKKYSVNPNITILLILFLCGVAPLDAAPFISYDSITVWQKVIIDYQDVAEKPSEKNYKSDILKESTLN